VQADDDAALDLAEDLEEPGGDAQAMGMRAWEHSYQPQAAQGRPLPEPISVELLNRLRVPSECHQRLLPLKSEDELLACPGIPDDILLRIDQYMFDLPLVQVEQQPDLILHDTDDLLRYREGELLQELLCANREPHILFTTYTNALVTLPTPRRRGLLVSTGAVTHQLTLAPLALSTKAPSGPGPASRVAGCFLLHSRHDQQCNHRKGTHAYGH
jgi:hypothetical protein